VIAVDVRNGVVYLGGRADSLAVREQAIGLTERVEGVVLVRSDVHVASDVRGRREPWG
jgi:osmotically-inducible protein OsmY